MLHELDRDHPDRNTPLSGFFYKWKQGKAWMEIKPSFAISKFTYNQLGSAWVDNDDFCKQRISHD